MTNPRQNILPSSVRWGLAPMEGVTDLAVRIWFALTAPPDFVWTPFLRVTDTFPAKLPTFYAPELTVLQNFMPFKLIPQVMGSRPDDIIRTSELLLPHADFLDLNCGCPSPTVVGNKSGSSLLETADIFSAFVTKTVRAVGPGRLSVKMRTGYHSSSEFQELIGAIGNNRLAQLTVHGRTRPQRYTGLADWSLIDHASRVLPFAVVGSGDILGSESADNALHLAPKIKAGIIGRGALRNPWVFGPCRGVPLIEPLVVFALLQEAGLSNPDLLLEFCRSGRALRCAADDADVWSSNAEALKALLGSEFTFSGLAVSSRALARVKMLWNYLRSSLPEPFMEPLIMRSKNLEDLISALNLIASQHGFDLNRMPLVHRSEHDWMYSGQGRGVSGKAVGKEEVAST